MASMAVEKQGRAFSGNKWKKICLLSICSRYPGIMSQNKRGIERFELHFTCVFPYDACNREHAMSNESEGCGEAAWREWKMLCALDLCSKSAVDHLLRFGVRRFRRYVNRVHGHRSDSRSAPMLDARDAWHRFEVYLAVNKSRAGKRYKDWLFNRARHESVRWEQVVEAGATLLMRDVVRDYLRREHAAPWMRSLQEPLCNVQGYKVTLEDLLPGTFDPSCEVEKREVEAMAERLASDLLPELSLREQIAIFARASGIPVSDPDILNAAGCGKSVLNESYHSAFHKLAGHVRETTPDASPEECTAFAVMTHERLKDAIISKIGSEIHLPHYSVDMKTIHVQHNHEHAEVLGDE